MNPHLLKTLFPNASASVLKANSRDYGDGKPQTDPAPERSRKNAHPKPVLRHDPLEEARTEEINPKRFLVRLVSVRKRLSDAESLVPKWHVDCLRYAGIIPDDTAELLDCFTTQRKCGKGEEECTEIEVYEL